VFHLVENCYICKKCHGNETIANVKMFLLRIANVAKWPWNGTRSQPLIANVEFALPTAGPTIDHIRGDTELCEWVGLTPYR
jgi:hypothetical protein